MVGKRNWRLITGFSLVLMALIAGFGYGYAFERLYKANDAIATFRNLQYHTKIYSQFVWSFVLVALLDLIVSVSLYNVFKEVQTKLSSIMAWLRIFYTILFAYAITHLFSVSFLFGEGLASAPIVMQQLEQFLSVWSLALIVFGIHLYLLGLLMYRSSFIPNAIGIVTMFAGVCYFFSNSANLVIPQYVFYKNTIDMLLALPMALGELGLAGWLMYIGFKKSIK